MRESCVSGEKFPMTSVRKSCGVFDPLLPHKKWPQAHAWGHFLSCEEEGSNSTAARRRQAISPVGCCLVRGSHPVGMSTGADAVARPQAHAWGHFLSCGEEGPNSAAARRRQAISPAISKRVCQRGLTNTHRIPIL